MDSHCDTLMKLYFLCYYFSSTFLPWFWMQNNLFFGSGYFSKLICNAFDFPDFSARGRFPELGFKRIFFWYAFTIFFWYLFFVLPVQYIWWLFFISFFFGCLKKKTYFVTSREYELMIFSKFAYYNLSSLNAFHRVSK